MGWTQCQSVLLLLWFWPLAASITMEVKNDQAHATTHRILKEFIEINFSLGCMDWLLCCLFQNWLPVKIFEILYQIKQNTKSIYMAISMDLWLYFFTIKLCWAQLFKWCYSKHHLKVRQIQNDFFKLTFLPKKTKEQIRLYYLSTCFCSFF